MFEIDNKYLIDSELPVIRSNYKILHFDEFPILFTGTNDYGNKILASLSYEDTESDTFRYFYLIVTESDYIKFIKRQLSYRGLFTNTKKVFILDKDINENVIRSYHVPLNEIPDDYLPLENVYCPNPEVVTGTELQVSLKGKLADMHEALATQVVIIQKNIAQFLTTALDNIRIKNLTTKIVLIPATASSYGINFRIKFDSQDIFFNEHIESQLNSFVTNYVYYSLTHLNSEAKNLKENNVEDTNFPILENYLNGVYELFAQKSDDKLRERLLNNILKAPFELEKITDQLGQGFDYVEVKSINSHANETSLIGLINDDFSTKLNIVTDIIESSENVDVDELYKTYSIHVYHLNINSRKGNAHIRNLDQDMNEVLDSPKIIIEGESGLDNSLFTKSMHEGTWIEVTAKSKKINGRYKTLTIAF